MLVFVLDGLAPVSFHAMLMGRDAENDIVDKHALATDGTAVSVPRVWSSRFACVGGSFEILLRVLMYVVCGLLLFS